MSNEIWRSTELNDQWLSLDDSGVLWHMQSLPPAPGGPGVRQPRTEGIGTQLAIKEIEELAVAAGLLTTKKHWALRARERKTRAAEERRKAWLRNQARSSGTNG